MTCEPAELVAHLLLTTSGGIIILFIVTVTSWSCIIEFLNHEVSNEVHDYGKEDSYPYKVKDI